MPDLIHPFLSGVAEGGVDGTELFGFRNIDGSFDELANGLFDLRSQLLQDGFDAFFAGEGRRKRMWLGRPDATPEREEGGCVSDLGINLWRSEPKSHPSTRHTPEMGHGHGHGSHSLDSPAILVHLLRHGDGRRCAE